MKRVYYTEHEKRLIYTMAVVKGIPVPKVVEIMRERFGRAPTEAGAYYIIDKIRSRNGLPSINRVFPESTKALAVELARSGRYRTSEELITAMAGHCERLPAQYTVCRWLAAAGVTIASVRTGGKPGFSEEARSEMIRLYKLNLPLKQIRAMLAPICGGKHPSRGWCNDVISSAGIRRAKNASRTVGVGMKVIHDDQAEDGSNFLETDYTEDEARTASMCKANRRRLWWSRETSENPRWNPDAGKSGRLAA